MSTSQIEARAEALCNLWGDDPNDDESWREALDHARAEFADGHQPEAIADDFTAELPQTPPQSPRACSTCGYVPAAEDEAVSGVCVPGYHTLVLVEPAEVAR